MPIYVYRAKTTTDCCLCAESFELTRKLSEPELTSCPECSGPIEQIITPPNIAGGSNHRLQEGHLEKHGFTQYRKVQKGVYEKTAGKGPAMIQDDGK